MFIVVFLLIGGTSVFVLSRGEFHHKAVAEYRSEILEWHPEILWSRDRTVALVNLDEPDRPIKALELGVETSNPVNNVLGIPTASILDVGDAPSGALTAMVYWTKSGPQIAVWKRTGEPLTTFPRPLVGKNVRTPRLAWDEAKRQIYCLMNCDQGSVIQRFDIDGESGAKFDIIFGSAKGALWDPVAHPMFHHGAIYAAAGFSAGNSPLYRIPVSSEGGTCDVSLPVALPVSKNGTVFTPSVVYAGSVVTTGQLNSGVKPKVPYSDFWLLKRDESPERLFNADDIWGATSAAFLPGQAFVVHTTSAGGDVWLTDPLNRAARQITSHANVIGAPLATGGPKVSELSYVVHEGGKYMIAMSVFPTESLQKATRGRQYISTETGQ